MKFFGRKVTRPLIVLAIVVTVMVIFGLVIAAIPPVKDQRLGVTFSTVYARQLGLDPRETFTALLDDVGVRHFRIPVYWSEVQPSEGEYRWEEIDWMMAEAATRGAEVTLAIGYKVPRWPECYIPDWAEIGGYPFDRDKLLVFLKTTVERYRDAPALARWQVENEPYLAFGVCPESDASDIAREVNLVRSLDGRPIVMTASGELERWGPTARQSDLLGVSLYRVTWNRYFGYFRYPVPAAFYRLRAWLVGSATDGIFISELQAEPWFPVPIQDRTPSEWAAEFTAKDLRENVLYAADTGIEEVDLWGAEWWYFLSKNGHAELWEEAVRLFAET